MLGTAYVQIEPQAKGIKGAISNVLGGEAESAGVSIGGKIGAFAKKAIIAAGIGTAAVKGIKAAMGEGAKLQQSYLGGLDTLYGEAADGVRQYAREAAEAGISMNDYSEQAVSFGASLKQAFGGDTHKAMEAANTAILDMADNSAKMGTPIESIQQAYQGFAKGQYQLLDNLKLGYGGTKTEMERLLSDAENLTGKEYNIDNLGDVYEAIHVIQGELGLTGVAADEASETFSGSFAAMKAAAANLFGSLALGEGVEDAMSQLIKSASTFFFKNFLPMLGTIAKNIPKALLTMIKKGFPALVKGIVSLIKNLTKSIEKVADGMTSEGISSWAKKNVPKILAAGAKLMLTLVKAIIINVPKIIAAVGKIALAIIWGLGAPLWSKLKAIFLVGWTSIRNITTILLTSIKTKISNIFNAIKTTVANIWSKIKTAITTPIISAKNTISSIVASIKSKVSGAFSGIAGKVRSAFNAVKDAITGPIQTAKDTVSGIISTIKGFFPLNLGKIFNLKLPHFKITSYGKFPWGVAGKGSPPEWSVDWYAKGGIFNSPTILGNIGLGEAGPEAILPLNPFWKKMDEMANHMHGGNTVNIYINGADKDPKAIAEEVKRVLIKETNQRRLAWQ